MRSLLLDFPWDLRAAVEDPTVGAFLLEFDGLYKREGLRPAPFLDPEECNTLPIMTRTAGNHGYEPLHRLLQKCLREVGGEISATPQPEPAGLKVGWKRALRDEMGDFSDWRCPQVIASESRRNAWRPAIRDEEVQITCEDTGPEKVHTRVIAFIGSYAEHKYARADHDPWDLRHCHPPASPAGPQHPCQLPRPQIINRVPLVELASVLASLRSESWPHAGRYCYIPPASWAPESVNDKVDWRKGAFPTAEANGRRGPRDYKGQVWAWDNQERHWDVQIGKGHKRIRHDGLEV
jgi:hypothetical protein